MKRLVSIMLTAVMLISACIMNVSAVDADAQDVSNIETRVLNEVTQAFRNYTTDTREGQIYDTYCHYADENTIDYVYVLWSISGGADSVNAARYLDYIIKRSNQCYPAMGLYIYDVDAKTIYTFKEAQDSVTAYLRDFLDNHSEEITNGSSNYTVYKCGDMDADGEISILDASLIQGYLAGINDFEVRDLLPNAYSYQGEKGVLYISDFDFDGERTVLDATAIQLKLAKLE
ncbi:MAG: hypothetical protein IJ275_02235 [Ruminococcus sp.]|nr:hypothetical protein [Ruminococcus sp.]